MQDVFYEESARILDVKPAAAKYYIFKTLSIFSYVLMALWIFVMIFFYPLPPENTNILVYLIFIILPLALFFVSGFILGRMKNKFYVEFDYTFVTGSIRISQVIKNTKRKGVIKFETTDIEKIGKYGSETFEKYYKMPNINKLILTSNVTPDEEKDFFYIVVNVESSKKLLILECTEKFIVHVLKFSRKGVLEENYK